MGAPERQTMACLKLVSVAVVCGALLQLARGAPSLVSDVYFNHGNRVCVRYSASDGFDGRSSITAATSTSYDEYNTTSGEIIIERRQHANDYIALFEADSCRDGQDRHQCYIALHSIGKSPLHPNQWEGDVCFELSDYRRAGKFEFRYFYGDDPQIDHNCTLDSSTQDHSCYSAHYYWDGNGYVCDTHAGIEGYVIPFDNPSPCNCNPTTGNATENEACTKNLAACKVCAKDAAAIHEIEVMEPFTYNVNRVQNGISNQITGLEIVRN